MEYAVEMGSGALIHIQSLIKIGSGIQKLTKGFTDRKTAWTLHKNSSIFQNKKSRLNILSFQPMYLCVWYDSQRKFCFFFPLNSFH
jgi:hypothetical protein